MNKKAKLLEYVKYITLIIALTVIGLLLAFYMNTQLVEVQASTNDKKPKFNTINEYEEGIVQYRTVYDTDTNVKYIIIDNGRSYGISVLYNADGTVQTFNEETEGVVK